MADWQPMGSAPKNATEVLLACEWKGAIRPVIVVAHWACGGGDEQPAFGPAWFYRTSGEGFYELPTHGKPLAWMQVPAPPLRDAKDVWCDPCGSFTCKPGCGRKTSVSSQGGSETE